MTTNERKNYHSRLQKIDLYGLCNIDKSYNNLILTNHTFFNVSTVALVRHK